MVLSEKNNYCINKETVPNQARKRTGNLASPWVGAVDLTGWGAHELPPGLCRPRPPSCRARAERTCPLRGERAPCAWPRGAWPALTEAAGPGLPADVRDRFRRKREERACLIVPETLICTKYYDYSGPVIIDSPTQPFSLRAVRFTNSTIF